MPLNSPILSGDISGGLHSTSVDKIKGSAVSGTAPASGQVLTWDGSQWAPAASTGGGGGGANGLTYYLRQDVDADAPTTNLPGTPKQLGRTGATGATSITSGTLTTGVWTLLGGYVSEAVPIDPNITAIPGGIWDFNLWAYGTANANAGTVIRALVYVYNGADAPTLLATSGEQVINNVSAQFSLSVLVPQTTVTLTDRIYVAVQVKASASNHTATLQFGDGQPSHVHTSLPLVGGTGLWKNVAGVLQSPASLLVDADVASDAAIASSKLATVQVAQGGTGQTSFTDGQLLIGNTATGGLSKATLTTSQTVKVLNSNGGIQLVENVGATYDFFEHFLSSTVPFQGGIGQSNNGGSVASASGATISPRLGVVNVSTGGTAAADQRGALNNAPSAIQIGGSDTEYYLSGVFGRSSGQWPNGTTTFGVFRFGFLSAVVGLIGTAEPTSGIYFRVLNAGNVEFVVRNGGTETAVSTSKVFALNNFDTYEILINAAATQVVAKIGGAIVATVTTNIPVAANRLGFVCMIQRASTDANSYGVALDWIYFRAIPNTPWFSL